MTTQRSRTLLILLCVLALALRLLAIIVLRAWQNPDAIEHRTIAISLLTGRGFAFNDFGYFGPTSFQSPPYPFLLAGLYKIFGLQSPAAYVAAMVINSLAGAAVVAMTFLLARALGATAGVALLASAAVAVWPAQIYACTVAQAIVLITLCITAVLGLFYVAVQSGRLRPWVAYCIAGTLAALTEPAFLPPLALTGLLILLWPAMEFRLRLRNAAVLLGMTLLVLGPWTLRNRMVHGAWVPVKSSFWVNTWKANNDYASGSDRLPMSPEFREKLKSSLLETDDTAIRQGKEETARAYSILTPEQRARLFGHPELEREKVFREITVNWIRAHPGLYARLCLIRFGKTLWIDWDNPRSYRLIYIGSRSLLLFTAAIGLLLAIRRRWALLIPAIFYGCTLALYTLTIAAGRFAIPFEPLMLCFSALAVATVYQMLRGRSPDKEMQTAPVRAATK